MSKEKQAMQRRVNVLEQRRKQLELEEILEIESKRWGRMPKEKLVHSFEGDGCLVVHKDPYVEPDYFSHYAKRDGKLELIVSSSLPLIDVKDAGSHVWYKGKKFTIIDSNDLKPFGSRTNYFDEGMRDLEAVFVLVDKNKKKLDAFGTLHHRISGFVDVQGLDLLVAWHREESSWVFLSEDGKDNWFGGPFSDLDDFYYLDDVVYLMAEVPHSYDPNKGSLRRRWGYFTLNGCHDNFGGLHDFVFSPIRANGRTLIPAVDKVPAAGFDYYFLRFYSKDGEHNWFPELQFRDESDIKQIAIYHYFEEIDGELFFKTENNYYTDDGFKFPSNNKEGFIRELHNLRISSPSFKYLRDWMHKKNPSQTAIRLEIVRLLDKYSIIDGSKELFGVGELELVRRLGPFFMDRIDIKPLKAWAEYVKKCPPLGGNVDLEQSVKFFIANADKAEKLKGVIGGDSSDTVDQLFQNLKHCASVDVPGYTVVRRLDSGGSSTVYQAFDNTFFEKKGERRYFAIKLMNPESEFGERFKANLNRGSSDVEDQFLNDIGYLLELEHPNISRIYSYGVIDDKSYIIQKYYNKGSLADNLHDLLWGINIISDILSG